MKQKYFLLSLFFWCSLLSYGQVIVSTLAGSGTAGNIDATGTAASFNKPCGVAVDASGNVYVADRINHKIRKITPAGVVSTFAGSGSVGSTDGTGTTASLSYPCGVAVDASGTVYVTDGNSKIRKITPEGMVSTLAGSDTASSTDGIGTAASFNYPRGIAVDASGNVYVADYFGNKIRKITPEGVVTTLAGSGSAGSTDGTGAVASFNNPEGIAVDTSGNVYVAEFSSHKIRKITPEGVVTTLAGSGTAGSTDGAGTAASFNRPNGVAVDASGNVYVAEFSSHKIRKITREGVVTTFAGSGRVGSTDGIGTTASFAHPNGVAVDASGNVYVADMFYSKIRKIYTPAVALSFDGVDDKVIVPYNPSFDFTTGTVEGWFKPILDSNNRGLFAMRSGGSTRWSFHLNQSGRLILWDGFSETNSINLREDLSNTWFHLACVLKKDETDIYLNGVFKGTIPVRINLNEKGHPLSIGTANDNGAPQEIFKGDIDEVRIWNRALSLAEIKNNMNCELGTGQTGLLAYYNFNKAGNTDQSLLTDLSGNNNTGTLTNFALSGATSNWVTNSAVTTGNQCAAVASLAITPTQTDVSCFGQKNGSATVVVSGGYPPYTYSWTNETITATASGLATGTYTVTVTDSAENTLNQKFTIIEPAALTVSKGSINNVSCFNDSNGSATVTATGGTAPYAYLWSNGVTTATAKGLKAGDYAVTVTDAKGCTATEKIAITQPTSALVATTSKTDISCNGESNGSATVTATGGTAPYAYLWSNGVTTARAKGLKAGDHSVTVTDAKGCTATEKIAITQPTSALVATTSKTDVSCNGESNGSATVSVTGGTAPYTYLWSNKAVTATAKGLKAGDYTVTVTDVKGCQTTQSFTITQPTSALVATVGSQTNVFCIGDSNGSATVSVTGGTGDYTYSWAPSGGTAATATNLTAGAYAVTITDINGCSVTKAINIETTPDVTAPVPTVASLPEITGYCLIIGSQIAIPTATDNCTGIIKATTTNPLTYNTEGAYVITWKYNDGNGNTTEQKQTLKVLASPLNQVTFSGADFTYDGKAHSLQVANLPAGANISYSANNTAVNAGIYEITATVTPPVSAPYCAVVNLKAKLVINKAPQQITFSAIPVKTLGANNSFNLVATSNSGLAVNYSSTYSTALPPATVSTAGAVNMLRSGKVLITAQQAGNGNYLSAPNVSQSLVILSNNIDVKGITLGTKVFKNPGKVINYLMDCGENNTTISILNESNASITPAANFDFQAPKPGIYSQTVTITSEDKSTTATYSITVEKPFDFFDIVQQKFDNVLFVNNNPQTNGGYEFVAYQWFKNGQQIGTGQYYSAGNDINTPLDPSADYSVKITTKEGKVLQTCATKIALSNSYDIKLYPNPVEKGKVITIEADLPKEELEKMKISLYSISGKLIQTLQSSTAKTEIQLPQTIEGNMCLVVLETPKVKKSFKVIVK
jgi:sugar lactone lactonase YvrE